MRRQLVPALVAMLLFTVLCGIAYPLVITGASQVAFNDKADGSFVRRNGEIVGSSLIGQNFSDPKYLWPRPSAAGATGYDGTASGGSNLGPTNPNLLDAVSQRADAYRQANGLSADQAVPVDAVTASGSGLDPHISVANARLQAQRVASARGIAVETVLQVIDDHTTDQAVNFLGERGVNVLNTNLALDQLS
jgi:K+-transporting ATPase ATPase C chain